MKKPRPVVSPARAYTILGDVAEYVREKLSKSYAKPLARGRLPVELRQFEPKPEGEF